MGIRLNTEIKIECEASPVFVTAADPPEDQPDEIPEMSAASGQIKQAVQHGPAATNKCLKALIHPQASHIGDCHTDVAGNGFRNLLHQSLLKRVPQ